jgi:hypothetical protein
MQIQRIPLVVLTLATGLIAVDLASAQRRYLNVKDPAEFRIGDAVFSGPQPGEQLRGFSVTPPTRTGRDEDFDPVALAAGKPHFLMFVDDSDLQEDITAWLAVRKIHQNSRTGLAATAVILGHERATKLEFTTIDDNFFNFLNGIFQIGYAPEGRDGPGAYGLDRNIKMTILITDAKGKVLYNFPYRVAPVDFPDPAVMGALAKVVGEDRETVEAWINEDWLNETTRRPKVQRVTAKRIIDYMDRNGDGKVSKDEAPGGLKPHFNQVDTNKDGGIDVKEAELIADLVGVTKVIERSNQQNAKSMRMKSTRKASEGKKK